MNLTVHLLTRNNAATVQNCLTSLQPLGAAILVGDFGSTDSTLDICRDYGANVVSLPWSGNYSKSRNNLVAVSQTEWQMWIEPWETLDSGHEQLLWGLSQNQDAFKVYNVQGEVLVKQTRVWKKSKKKFIRPVYESLDPEGNEPLLHCSVSGTVPSKFDETMKILQEEARVQPHAADTDYYIACTYVMSGRYDEFLKHAERFFFRSSEVSVANILTHYYYALVQLFAKKNSAKCIEHVVYCLTKEPTLAEFWCLLGDAFVRMKQFHRASAFYDNAVIFGSRRLANDPYPIEIVKYKEYPEKMLHVCREAVKIAHGLP